MYVTSIHTMIYLPVTLLIVRAARLLQTLDPRVTLTCRPAGPGSRMVRPYTSCCSHGLVTSFTNQPVGYSQVDLIKILA